jgi:hypothetical protein
MAKIVRHELGPSPMGGRIQRFDRVKGRGSGPKEAYNYLNERMKLASMLKRPAWMEYPSGEEVGSVAEFPLIHIALSRGTDLWIADDDECVGLLGMDEETRNRIFPHTQWVVVVEHEGKLIAQQRSEQPNLGGLTAAVKAALVQAAGEDTE